VAEIFRSPPGKCAVQDADAPARPPVPTRDDAPLTVRAGPRGVILASRGATAGRVLVEQGRVFKRGVRVEGLGASVRVWARIDGRPFDEVASAIARSAGLARYEADDPFDGYAGADTLTWLDPARAAALHHARALGELERTPLETRWIPSRTPRESARVLAATELSCFGHLVASPRTGVILATDFAGNLNHFETLLAALEHGEIVDTEWGGGTPPDLPEELSCDAIAPAVPPNLPAGATAATGAAAGDALLRIAIDAHADVIIGCGGDRAAFYQPPPSVTIETAARALGLAPAIAHVNRPTPPAPPDGFDLAPREHTEQRPLAFTSAAVADQWVTLENAARMPARPTHLRTFRTPHYDDLEVAAETVPFHLPGAVVSYAPMGLLVAVGTAEKVAWLEGLVNAWGTRASP